MAKNFDFNMEYDMDMLILEQTAITSKLGQVDQGSPQRMKRLEGRGFVKAEGSGWVITHAGLQAVRIHRTELKHPNRGQVQEDSQVEF